jgi:putative transposase
VKYACIARHEGEHAVRLMCRVLAVAPSGFYRWRACGPSARARADAALLVRVRAAYDDSDQTYGAPRIHRDLQDEDVRVGKKRVARLMRRAGMAARAARRAWVHTTDSTHAYPIAANVLDRQFVVAQPDRVWVSDITYVPTRLGFLYLAVVMDLASRRVVGWAMREDLAAELALGALRMALAARRPAPGLLHHSDRGVQYACGAYRQLLEAHGLRASMSRKGNCWDNAVAESFFATLEWELIARRDWRSPDEARQDIFAYIETWYNRRRRHSHLDYRSPAHYEAQLRDHAA